MSGARWGRLIAALVVIAGAIGVSPTPQVEAQSAPRPIRTGATVILVPGFGTARYGGVTRDADGLPYDVFSTLRQSLLASGFGVADIVEFGYGSLLYPTDRSTGIAYDYPCDAVNVDPYGQRGTLTGFEGLVRSVERTRPNDLIAIVGHSYGGFVALQYAEAIAQVTRDANRVSLIMTVDSPLEGAAAFRTDVGRAFGCMGGPALDRLVDAHRNAADTRGQNMRRVSIAQHYGAAVATIGNANDCLYRPRACDSVSSPQATLMGAALGLCVIATDGACLLLAGGSTALWQGTQDNAETQIVPNAAWSGYWTFGENGGIRESHNLVLRNPDSVRWMAQTIIERVR